MYKETEYKAYKRLLGCACSFKMFNSVFSGFFFKVGNMDHLTILEVIITIFVLVTKF